MPYVDDRPDWRLHTALEPDTGAAPDVQRPESTGSRTGCRRVPSHTRVEKGSSDMVRAHWNGAVIAESDDTVIIDGNHYFPAAAVNEQDLVPSDTSTVCPWKGRASYYSLRIDGADGHKIDREIGLPSRRRLDQLVRRRGSLATPTTKRGVA